jgi:hypothetical protein
MRTSVTAGDTEAMSAPPLAVIWFFRVGITRDTDDEPVDAADRAISLLDTFTD